MGVSTISLGLGLGGGKAATSSGTSSGGGGGGAFQITILNTESNILSRAGDPVGTIAFGTDTHDYYISDGNNNWSITLNVLF